MFRHVGPLLVRGPAQNGHAEFGKKRGKKGLVRPLRPYHKKIVAFSVVMED